MTDAGTVGASLGEVFCVTSVSYMGCSFHAAGVDRRGRDTSRVKIITISAGSFSTRIRGRNRCRGHVFSWVAQASNPGRSPALREVTTRPRAAGRDAPSKV